METPPPFLSWLHISDSHFQKDTGWRDNIARTRLLEFLQEKFKNNALCKPDFIFFTGDLAFGQVSGSTLSTQYDEAWEFLAQLRECCGVPPERIFTVPGNHDVNRKAFLPTVKSAFRHIDKEDALEIFNGTEPFTWQNEYGAFVSEHLPHQHQASKEGRHYYATTIEHNGQRIAIAGLNTAWMCTGEREKKAEKNEKGNFRIALEPQLNGIDAQLPGKHAIRILLMHHPRSWLDDSEETDCKERFLQRFDFVLNGHQHNTWVEGNGPVYIAVGALGAENKDEFGFNLTYLFQGGNGKSHLFCFGRDKQFIPKIINRFADNGIYEFQFPYRGGTQTETNDITAEARQATEATFEKLQEIHFTFKAPNDVQRGIPAEHFVGRDALLKQLREKLTPGSPTGIFGLDGMGGIGKSELARQLVMQLAAEHAFRDGILWLRVHRRSYEETFGDVWKKLGGKLSALPFERKEEILKNELNQHNRMLVILDNCDEPERIARLRELFSRQPILITARNKSLDPLIHWEAVDTLKDEDGRALLRQLCPALGKIEDARLDKVLKKIHGLPLAITRVGVWFSSTGRTPEEYCNYFDHHRLAALRPPGDERSERERDIYACFDVSWESLAPEERLVFAICSLFGGDSFPEELLITWLKDIPYFSAHDLDDEKIKALVDRLYQEKMLERPDPGRLAVHALLSEYGSEKLSQTDELKDIGVKKLQKLLVKQIEENGQNFAPREKQLIENTIMRLDDKADAYKLWKAADDYWIDSNNNALRARICDRLLGQYSPDTQEDRDRERYAELLLWKADALIRMGHRNEAKHYLEQCLAVSQDDERKAFWAGYLLRNMVIGDDRHLLLLNNLRKSFKLPDYKAVIDTINRMLQETLWPETGEMCYTFVKNRISIQSNPFNLCLAYENYAILLVAKGDIAAAEEALSKLRQSAQQQNILPGILASIRVEAHISYWKGDKDKARQGWQTVLDQKKQQEGWAGVNDCQIFLHALELESGSVDLPSLQRLRDDADQAGLNDVKFAAQCLLIEQELRAGKHGPTLQRALEAVKDAAVGARNTAELLYVMLLTIWHELNGELPDWTKIEARMARVQATFAAWQAQPLLCKRLFDIVQPMVAARRTTPARTLRPGKAAKPYSLLPPLITGKGLPRQLTGKDGMKLCLVPSGLYPTYSPEGEKQALATWVYPFYIDEHPVTFAQYRRFCQETGHDLPPVDKHLGHNDPRYLAAPVTNISPEDARAYAQWAGRLLPVAQEWSAAATGPEGRRFPWGETLDRVEFPGNANATPFCFPEFDPSIVVDAPAFFALLQGSLSLGVNEKAKVINAVPTLYQFQVDELIKTFEDEKEKFVELVEKHPGDVQYLQKCAVINWNVITSQRLRTYANRNVCQVQNDQAACGARDFVGLVREWIDPGANREEDRAIGLPYIPGKPDETEAMMLQHTSIAEASRGNVGFRCVLPLMERDLLPEAVKTVLDRWQPDI